MQHYRLIYERVLEETSTTRRTKVAILDTGLDRTHPSIQGYRRRIKDVWSWLPSDHANAGVDASGHGTYVTALFLDIAPDCDVYIAQIADSRPISPDEIAKVRNQPQTNSEPVILRYVN